jgi:NTE family protein
MDKKLAFVFSGGGSRGALQVGALRALLEHGLQPDLLVGTSIGAVNAAFLAVNGFSQPSLVRLTESWRQTAELGLLPSNYVWLTVRAMFRRSSQDPSRRIRDFFISGGVTPEMHFADLPHAQLIIVSSDLNTGQPVMHGLQLEDKVLDALLLSTALPPWVMPVRKQGRYLMDGAVVSNLPIEPALRMGATMIVALDLLDPPQISERAEGFTGFLGKLSTAVEKRQAELELELAEACRVPTLHLELFSKPAVPFWDFKHTEELIEQGYEIACRVLAEQSPVAQKLLPKLQQNFRKHFPLKLRK